MNSIIIDSSLCQTSLCFLCSKAGTDKGPFTPGGGHRHPYTTPYSLFFEPLRHKNIKLAEVGVHYGASMRVWRAFFSQARLYGFDNDEKNVMYIDSIATSRFDHFFGRLGHAGPSGRHLVCGSCVSDHLGLFQKLFGICSQSQCRGQRHCGNQSAWRPRGHWPI